MLQDTIKVLRDDGETVCAEIVAQDGGSAAMVRVAQDDFLTDSELGELVRGIEAMRSRLKEG